MNSPELLAAEESLIGVAFSNPNRVIREANLSPEHFSNDVWRSVWSELVKAVDASENPDPLTIVDRVGGTPTLQLVMHAAANAGAPDHAPHWANIVREGWLNRQLTALTTNLTGDPQADLAAVRTRLERLETSTGRTLPTLDSLLIPDYDKPSGLPSGLGIGRVSPSDIPKGRVTVIFGETGNFKSTVSNTMLWSMASAGHKVLNVPLEDANELNSMRFLARETGIPYGRLEAGYVLTEAERRKVASVGDSFKRTCSNVIMGGEIPPDIDEIIRQAAYYKRQCGIDAVIIDYLQCLEPPKHMRARKEYEFVKYVMRRLQAAAKRDNIAIILVNQIDKESSKRIDDPRPRDSDMLGGASVKQMSKLTIGVHRPSRYYPEPVTRASHYTSVYRNAFNNLPNGAEWWKNLLMLYILKNVAGETEVILHASVHPPTGVIIPIDNIEDYL